MKAIKRAYSASGGGVDMESMQELYFGSIEEREALADAITNKGVDTNVADSLFTMAEKIGNIENNNTGILEIQSGGNISVSYTKYTTHSKAITFPKAFSKVPTVWVDGTNHSISYSVFAGNITKTGFTLYYGGNHESTNGSSGVLKWVAYTTK